MALLFPGVTLAPGRREAAGSPGRKLCPSLRRSLALGRPRRSLLGFVNNNPRRGSSPGTPCARVPCPAAGAAERQAPGHGLQWWGCLGAVPKTGCVRSLHISQPRSPQKPRRVQSRAPDLPFYPWNRTPFFSTSLSPICSFYFFPTFTISDKRVVVEYGEQERYPTERRRHFTFRKLPGVQKNKL